MRSPASTSERWQNEPAMAVTTAPMPAATHLLVALTLAGALLTAGCAKEKEGGKRPPPMVRAAPVIKHRFVDMVEAVGTARANEQVTIAASVTERVDQVLFGDSMPVAHGQLLAVLSQGQEAASLNGAIAARTQASGQYGRIKNLFDRGFATRAQLDLQLAAAQRAEADAAHARAAIADRMIRAPFAGFTGLRTISAGAIVQAGTPLVTVSDISRIKLDFTIPETQLAWLAPGQTVEATADAFPEARFTGKIASIDPVIDPASRAVMVRAILPNPGARLKPGMLLNVRVRRDERMADAVPELAVIGNGRTRAVFVMAADGKARRVAVETGLRNNGLIEVTGLPQGARVITEGALKVTDGMKVRLPGKNGAGKSGPRKVETAAAS
jgi:membrane fusion protein (multidrug efflux system)